MKALQQQLSHILGQPLNIRLKALLTKKTNSCWVGNVRGFWFKISKTHSSKPGIDNVRIEISFLKPIKNAQISLERSNEYEASIDEDLAERNETILSFHDKRNISNNVSCLLKFIEGLDLAFVRPEYIHDEPTHSELLIEVLRHEYNKHIDERIEKVVSELSLKQQIEDSLKK